MLGAAIIAIMKQSYQLLQCSGNKVIQMEGGKRNTRNENQPQITAQLPARCISGSLRAWGLAHFCCLGCLMHVGETNLNLQCE